MLVFAISEGGTYGWFVREEGRSTILGATIWPTSMPVSIVPVAFLSSACLLFAFYRVQSLEGTHGPRPAVRVLQPAAARVPVRHDHAAAAWRWARSRSCLVDVGHAAGRTPPVGARHRPLARAVGRRDRRRLAARQLADPPHRNDQRGARRPVPRGDRARRRARSPTPVALVPGAAPRRSSSSGSASDSRARSSTTSSSPTCRPSASGAASGANTTVRMIGASLGIAVISSLLTTQTIRHAVGEVGRAASLPTSVPRSASSPRSTPAA